MVAGYRTLLAWGMTDALLGYSDKVLGVFKPEFVGNLTDGLAFVEDALLAHVYHLGPFQ